MTARKRLVQMTGEQEKNSLMRPFDWHSDPITRDTPVTETYRNTQNVRRFLKAECGEGFAFDRAFMAWIVDGRAKTMGEVADEWLKRRTETSR